MLWMFYKPFFGALIHACINLSIAAAQPYSALDTVKRHRVRRVGDDASDSSPIDLCFVEVHQIGAPFPPAAVLMVSYQSALRRLE